jgi:hypothetical protein
MSGTATRLKGRALPAGARQSQPEGLTKSPSHAGEIVASDDSQDTTDQAFLDGDQVGDHL